LTLTLSLRSSLNASDQVSHHKLKKAQRNTDTTIKTIHQFTAFETAKAIKDNPIKRSLFY
jgi:hypothetical protein